MLRDAGSMIAARYSHPSPVAMYVMSETHFRFGSGDSKFLFRMFGTIEYPWRESVVRIFFLFVSARIPSSRIIRSTQCFAQSTPFPFNACGILGLPYTRSLSSWIFRISSKSRSRACRFSSLSGSRRFHSDQALRDNRMIINAPDQDSSDRVQKRDLPPEYGFRSSESIRHMTTDFRRTFNRRSRQWNTFTNIFYFYIDLIFE